MPFSLKDRIKSLIKRRAEKADTKNGEAKPTTTATDTDNPGQSTSSTQTFPALWQPRDDAQQPIQQKQVKTLNRVAVSSNQTAAATATGTLTVALENRSSSNQMYAYITGQAVDNGNALFLLQADGKTPYYPPSPSSTGTKINVNISIPLGAPGNTVTATIPRLAGGRIWFSQGAPLTFLLNPGPGLVEPSVFNSADPNYNVNFGFCEFTYNASQVFVNLSYVDFVSGIPVALTLQDTSGATQHVGGMRADGFATVCQGLRAQSAKDGRRWSKLIVQSGGKDLRALSPNSAITINPDWFQTYWTDYVNQVYAKYKSTPLTIDTQASYGEVKGTVNSSGSLDFGDGSVFAKPNAKDIFGNNTGPFATGSNSKTNTIIPRLAAGFCRSTLLLSDQAPNGTNASQYYTNATTDVSLDFSIPFGNRKRGEEC